MDQNELIRRFRHHPPSTPEIVAAHEDIRNKFEIMALFLNEILPDSREKSNALTALEESSMHANATIARHQRVGNEPVAEYCPDWPAPCNCDDPITHNGHKSQRGRDF